MAKRQKRYLGNTLNEDELSHLLNKKVNIVFKNGNVIFVLITRVDGDKIEAKNMRSQLSVIDIKDIAEIILDYKG